jgi:hypothetical protein
VKAHAGIKENEKADMLAKRGQSEVCAIGRYSAIMENSSAIQPLISSPKKFEKKNYCSPNNFSKDVAGVQLDDKNTKHETTNIQNFLETNLDSQSTSPGLGSPSHQLSSASSSPWM